MGIVGEQLVALRGVSKRFGGVQALSGVDVDIAPGSIHGFVGENGAGKSTLGKVIAGVHRPDSGTMKVAGRVLRYHAPRDALNEGVALISQELSLVPQLTVAENVMLGREPRRLGVVARRDLRGEVEGLPELGFELPLDRPVGELRTADQQKVEIMRAIARSARLIVMDEPTASLTKDESKALYAMIRERAALGTTIVFVSHALEDVLALCDMVTILRDGKVVKTAPAAAETVDTLVKGMIGRDLEAVFPSRRPALPEAPVVLETRSLGVSERISDVSLTVRAGEIVGLAGLVGSGRSEFARAIFGADPADRGEILLEGKRVRIRSPREAISHGIAMLPESRKEQGLVMVRSITENVSLANLGNFQSGGVVRRRRERDAAKTLCEQVGVGAAQGTSVAGLSGGNQQKVLFAKWLCRRPRLLIADEPTRGVDIGAKQAIYELIAELAAEGMAVLLISSELEEVLGLAHRTLVLREGRIAGQVGRDASQDEVLRMAFGHQLEAEAA